MSESTLTYGLNTGGFVRMRLPEIRRAIYNDLTSRTGVTFDETPDSFTGQFISIFAEREAALWELAERAYLSAYPATAQGIPLDLAVSYAGVKRLQPAKSRALIYLFGLPGTTIPAGAIVQGTVPASGNDVPPRFSLENAVTISRASVISAYFTIPENVVAGTSYWFEIDGVRQSITAQSGQTAGQIALAFDNLYGNVTLASSNGITFFKPNPFVLDYSPTLSVVYIVSLGYLIAEDDGPIVASENTLTRIISPVDGWQAVNNPGAAVVGTTLETDDSLRVRYSLGVYRLGAGTVPSIYANLTQDVPGVISAKVFENTGDVVDSDGRPAHSVEAVIEGGSNEAIFQKIYQIKPAGIAAYGNTSGFVRSADGYQHPISFSRPELRWIWLRVAITTTTEETVPGDIGGKTIAAVLTAGGRLVPGQDVLLQRLGAAPVNATTGLARVVVTAAVTAPNATQPATYSANDIIIGPRQKAVFDASRIVLV